MRRLFVSTATAFAFAALTMQSAGAALVGSPMALRSVTKHIKVNAPTLPPLAFTQFCIRYETECRVRPLFRGGPIRLTEDKIAVLNEVNQSVNRKIVPERNEFGLAGEQWLINPIKGDCNDYAVSKRHELIARGWPARALLLSEVVVNSGEHHLVLVVRTTAGDLILDNMTQAIKPWSRAPYRWVRMQQPYSKLWTTVWA